jgi:hypothetical protein
MPEPSPGPVALAITHSLISTSEADRLGESANLVDAVFAVARALDHLASAISEANEHADGPRQGGPPNIITREVT